MRPLRVLLAALALVPVLLLPTTPAAAFDGKLNLDVAGDGATGVTIRASYADGHQLETIVRLVLTATDGTGDTVGPVQLEPSGEGQGFYTTGPILSPGRWQVTVTAPAPNPAEAVVTVEAKAEQAAPKPAPNNPVALTKDRGLRSGVWWLIGGALLIAAAGSAVLLARNRNS
ncbi:hypothetical protein OG792_03220 [Micromonospora sp. NBC_01699]|uniref:hypothetical protein n=1 Tax=Micromonospora sp. NBC_01699 TaxID=2975984 RepID=UPI002E2E6321|nr:hypothetical protein [Micromonospora sp. NBC_01699]